MGVQVMRSSLVAPHTQLSPQYMKYFSSPPTIIFVACRRPSFTSVTMDPDLQNILANLPSYAVRKQGPWCVHVRRSRLVATLRRATERFHDVKVIT